MANNHTGKVYLWTVLRKQAHVPTDGNEKNNKHHALPCPPTKLSDRASYMQHKRSHFLTLSFFRVSLAGAAAPQKQTRRARKVCLVVRKAKVAADTRR